MHTRASVDLSAGGGEGWAWAVVVARDGGKGGWRAWTVVAAVAGAGAGRVAAAKSLICSSQMLDLSILALAEINKLHRSVVRALYALRLRRSSMCVAPGALSVNMPAWYVELIVRLLCPGCFL